MFLYCIVYDEKVVSPDFFEKSRFLCKKIFFQHYDLILHKLSIIYVKKINLLTQIYKKTREKTVFRS